MRGNFELLLKNGKKRFFRYYGHAFNAFLKEYGFFTSLEQLDTLLHAI